MAAYKKQSDPSLAEDIHKRKEFAQLWVPPDNDFRTLTDLQTQQQFAQNFANPNTQNLRVHLMHSTGCHAAGTMLPLLLDNFHVIFKRVEDIVVGDRLVDPNGKFVAVMQLHRGTSQMYKIMPHSREMRTYIVNANHILYLRVSCGNFVNMTVRDYIRHSREGMLVYRAAHGEFIFLTFDIAEAGTAEYFGFKLASEDGLFLGADGLILHNSGKTRAALAPAQEFIKMYRTIYRGVNMRDTSIIAPSVFIIAFGGKFAFLNDLMKVAEFGYVSAREYEALMQYYRESTESDDAYKKYADLWSQFKRRITNRAKGGFYKFLGYDELVNRLFGADAVKLNDIILQARRNHEPYCRALESAITHGGIAVDQTILARFNDSLIIADEIHNTYNTQTINNRGLAIQYILNHAQNVRFISLSATPINGVPEEIADFINYFVPAESAVMRESLFSGHSILPGAIERINTLLRGCISFLYDIDPKFFPRRIDCGVPIAIGRTELQYLRFTPCPMSDFMMATIRDYRARNEQLASDEDADDTQVGITQGAFSLFDFVFPNPASEEIGLYNSANLFSTLHTASSAWKEQAGVVTKSATNIPIIGGPFLALGRIEKYSPKYAQLVVSIRDTIKQGGPCKIMVYHERVRTSGVILACEVLHENGLIDENESASDATLCAICAIPRGEHGAAHEFRPLRYVAIYSELDATTILSIRDRYNSTSNLHGEWCSVLVGSHIIHESYDFQAVRHLFILTLPASISQLIQVFGRCVRRLSHHALPAEERNVNVHILVHTAGGSLNEGVFGVNNATDSPEIHKYVLKLRNYETVQIIERELARNAIDAGINKNINTIPAERSLGISRFEESIRFKLSNNLAVDTFFAYGYGMQEIQFAIDTIKKLFVAQNAWRGDNLIAAIKDPPFGVRSNPALISDSSVAIALSYLLSSSGMIGDRAVVANGTQYQIIATRDSAAEPREILDAEDNLFLAPIESVEVAGITKMRPLIDVEASIRGTSTTTEIRIPTAKFELSSSFEQGILGTLRADYSEAAARGRGLARLIGFRSFLVKLSADQQRLVARNFIDNAKIRAEFPTLFEFMRSLGIFVPYSFAIKYRDIARRFAPKFKPAHVDDPIAYGDGDSVKLYTGDDWVSVSRSSLNMHIEFEENNIMVGTYKQFPYEIKFQLRPPAQKLRQSRRGNDARKIERGSVCITGIRSDVERHAQKLGIPIVAIHAAQTTSSLCDLIQVNLLRREMEERADSHSIIKFVYGWWNAPLLLF